MAWRSSISARPWRPTGRVDGPAAVSAALQNLTPATTYHVRLFAFGRGGVGRGDDVPFTTLPAASIAPAPVAPHPRRRRSRPPP